MHKKLLPLLGLFVVLTASTLAQNINFQGQETTRSVIEDGVNSPARPRVAPEKSSAVKASVIVNTVRIEQMVFEMVNQKRVENGLTPLVWSDGIAASALFMRLGLSPRR